MGQIQPWESWWKPASTSIAKRELYVSSGGDTENANRSNNETQNKSSLKTIVLNPCCVTEKNFSLVSVNHDQNLVE